MNTEKTTELEQDSSLADGKSAFNDGLGHTIDAAEYYADQYEGDDRQDIKTDVLNAFYAGVEFSKKLRHNDKLRGCGNENDK